jgi:mannan endo-1,4-beta-mannosidase
MVDKKATPQTQALYYNLKNKVMGKMILFGQHDATYYGIGWKDGQNLEPNRSDIQTITGAYPAVYGWDLENVVKALADYPNVNKAEPENIRELVKDAYKRGGINTFSWHVQNFVTGKNFYDTTRCVHAILPGGEKHAEYKKNLDVLAGFFLSLKDDKGNLIPVIFRPFHEHTGKWFWWGEGHCSREEFISLWQFTVKYLRDTKKVHNLLYAYSPDKLHPDNASKFGGKDFYLARYPGDEYVDILGHDSYWDLRDYPSSVTALESIRVIVKLAKEKDKIPALTETGLDKLTTADWYTNVLLKRLKEDELCKNLAYIMVWRNAHENHFYVPYPGHPATEDFKKFYQDPWISFADKMPDLYKTSKVK